MTDSDHVHPAVRQRMAREYAKSVKASDDAVASARVQYGETHPQVAESLSALGKLHQAHSDFQRAESAFIEALTIREKSPSDVAGQASALRDLARLHDASGQAEKGCPLMQRAARIESEAFQTHSPPVESAEPKYNFISSGHIATGHFVHMVKPFLSSSALSCCLPHSRSCGEDRLMTEASRPLECPACGQGLVEKAIDELTVDVCENGCGGIWFDNGEILDVDDRDEAMGESLTAVKERWAAAVDPTRKRKCPRCDGIRMLKRQFGPRQPVEIDECPGCGGIWLDAGELKAIRETFADGENRAQVEAAMSAALASQVQLATVGEARTTQAFHAVAKFLGHMWHDYNLMHFRGREWPPWRGTFRDGNVISGYAMPKDMREENDETEDSNLDCAGRSHGPVPDDHRSLPETWCSRDRASAVIPVQSVADHLFSDPLQETAMTQSIKDTLDLRDETPASTSDVRVSKLAKSAVGFGVVSCFIGLLSIGVGPIHSGWLLPDIPDWIGLVVSLSVLTGFIALVLSIVGSIRIACSCGRFRGQALCLGGAGLAILGNVIWVGAIGKAFV